MKLKSKNKQTHSFQLGIVIGLIIYINDPQCC